MSNKTEIMLGPSADKEGNHIIARYEDGKVEILLIESDNARFLSIPTIERYTSRISELEAENKRLREALIDAKEDAAALIEQQRWIPVTERLPEEESKRYLCYAPHFEDDPLIACFNADGKWYEEGFDITEYVTHWQPLSQPPKEQ